MTPLTQRCRISSASEFGEFLHLLKLEVARGAFRQLWPTEAWTREEAIDEIADDGPWPDYIEMLFEEANSGQPYRLSVEAYRGTGGTWERV